MQVRPQNTIILRQNPAQINAQPRHAAAPVGQQNSVIGFPDPARSRAGGRRQSRIDSPGLGLQKLNYALHAPILLTVSLQEKRRLELVLHRGKTGDVLIAGENRLDMWNRRRVFNTKRGAERSVILEQKPVTRWHQSNAPLIEQLPGDHARKRF